MVAAHPIDPPDSAELLAAARDMFAAAQKSGVRVTEEQFRASLRGLPSADIARIASGYAATLDDWIAMGLDPNEDPLDGDAVPIDQAIDDGSLGLSRADWERLCASSS
jgi:hypothetical protein